MGEKFKIPGFTSTFDSNSPIGRAKDFYWREALNYPLRIPQQMSHANNILVLAARLQRLRDEIGKPFIITSWYRPEPWNSQAGGVSNSVHLSGGAVDFWIPGWDKWQMYEFFDSRWSGGVGIYGHNDIIHLDIGTNRRW